MVLMSHASLAVGALSLRKDSILLTRSLTLVIKHRLKRIDVVLTSLWNSWRTNATDRRFGFLLDQSFDIFRTKLLCILTALIGRSRLCHIFQLDVIGVKILNYPDVVILLGNLRSIVETPRISFGDHLLLILRLCIKITA